MLLFDLKTLQWNPFFNLGNFLLYDLENISIGRNGRDGEELLALLLMESDISFQYGSFASNAISIRLFYLYSLRLVIDNWVGYPSRPAVILKLPTLNLPNYRIAVVSMVTFLQVITLITNRTIWPLYCCPRFEVMIGNLWIEGLIRMRTYYLFGSWPVNPS